MVLTKDFHVFTPDLDEYFEDYDRALTLFNKWATEYGSTRIYEEEFIDDELASENCLESSGYFPS
jgi:hypothetical protein